MLPSSPCLLLVVRLLMKAVMAIAPQLVIDLSGIHNVGRAIKKGKPVIFLLTPMGKVHPSVVPAHHNRPYLHFLTPIA